MFTGETLRTSKPEPRIASSMLHGWCIYPIFVSVFAAQQWQDVIFVCQEATCGKFFVCRDTTCGKLFVNQDTRCSNSFEHNYTQNSEVNMFAFFHRSVS